MRKIKQDVRFEANAFEKIRQIAEKDKASIQDTIRALCDIGIAQKLDDNSREIRLTPVEEEMLLTLKSISAMTNVLTVNMVDPKKTPHGSVDELARSIKKSASDALLKFKNKQSDL